MQLVISRCHPKITFSQKTSAPMLQSFRERSLRRERLFSSSYTPFLLVMLAFFAGAVDLLVAFAFAGLGVALGFFSILSSTFAASCINCIRSCLSK